MRYFLSFSQIGSSQPKPFGDAVIIDMSLRIPFHTTVGILHCRIMTLQKARLKIPPQNNLTQEVVALYKTVRPCVSHSPTPVATLHANTQRQQDLMRA